MGINTIFDPDNAVWSFLLKLYYLAFAGLLWFISSLPIITIGAATASLYSYCFQIVNGTEGYTVRTFFSTFKRIFIKATAAFLIIVGIVGFLVFDAWFFSQTIPPLFFVAMSLTLIVLISCIHVFPILTLKDLPLKEVFKESAILGLRHLPVSVTVLVIHVLFLISVYFFPPSILFTYGFITALSVLFIRTLYMRIDF